MRHSLFLYPLKKPLPWLLSLLLYVAIAAPLQGYGPNLLINPAFDASFAGWSTRDSIPIVWAPSDADGSVVSGSVKLINNTRFINTGVGINQCVPVAGGASYFFAASAWIPVGSPTDSRAGMGVTWYNSANCAGVISNPHLDSTGTQGKWVDLAATAVAPQSALSAQLFLVSLQGDDPSVDISAYFDNAFLGTGTCAPSSTQLCLNKGRFQVQVTWTTPDGISGPGKAVPFASDSGNFWFFDPTNIELSVKVLNACVPALGNRYWFFASGLTNVKVTLTVTDTQSGAAKTYNNLQDQVFRTITDTNAFATCP